MKRVISILTIAAAGILVVCFAESDMVLPALICDAYAAFWTYANMREPRKSYQTSKKSRKRAPQLYDLVTPYRMIEEVKATYGQGNTY